MNDMPDEPQHNPDAAIRIPRPEDDWPKARQTGTSVPGQQPEVSSTDQRSFSRLHLKVADGCATIVRREKGGLFVLPDVLGEHRIEGEGLVWLLAPSGSGRPSILVRVRGGATVRAREGGVEVEGPACSSEEHSSPPRADAMGNRFSFRVEHGEEFEEALAAFYWDTMVPCIVERTAGASYPDPDGFVRSSPSTERFAGTYPACDHEFGIKGRIAFGDEVDLAVVGRMIDLELRMMRENPDGFWGCPCAVQPDGVREYFWRRATLDGSNEAQMFRLSGNAEVQENAWLYYALTKDRAWLEARIEDMERATKQIVRFIDPDGWLEAHAFYEDAVIKDGCSTESTALTANALRLLAQLETALGRIDQARHFADLSERIAARLSLPLPEGHWNPANRRFVDWIDRRGVPHDHMQLPANILPPLLGWATEDQTEAVAKLVQDEFAEFQRFPSFVSARIADYTDSEIGIHGPFDSCAMARTWCWDAAYWHSRGEGEVLLGQLLAVARKGKESGWHMAERYDMGHVYYADGTDFHGSTHYYEYPCVFAWVLIHDYLGVRIALDVDLEIAPRLVGDGDVRLDAPSLAIEYRKLNGVLSITNLAPRARTFRIEGVEHNVCLGPGESWTDIRG
ncbi:MAG TPA: hypothetical protein VGM51_06470 [Armatimonadota bacterium]|jgi:hypothetical protein